MLAKECKIHYSINTVWLSAYTWSVLTAGEFADAVGHSNEHPGSLQVVTMLHMELQRKKKVKHWACYTIKVGGWAFTTTTHSKIQQYKAMLNYTPSMYCFRKVVCFLACFKISQCIIELICTYSASPSQGCSCAVAWDSVPFLMGFWSCVS